MASGTRTSRVNITSERIRKLTKELADSDRNELMLWDLEQKGLGVRVRAGREPAYIYAFRQDKKFRKIALGACSAMTVEDARALARSHAFTVADGLDPEAVKQEKAEERAAKKAKKAQDSLRLGEAWQNYIEANRARWSEGHIKDHQKMMVAPGQPRTRAKVKTTVAGTLWPLRDERLVDLPALVPDWAKREAAVRPTTTKKALTLLKTFLLEHDIALKDALGRSGQAKLRKALPKAKVKKVSLEASQLAAWWTGTLLLPPATSAYLRFQLLTGARPTEGATLTWNNADLKWNTLKIRDKVAGERTIPLTPYIRKLLLELRDYGKVVDIKRAKRKYEPTKASGGDDKPEYVFKAMTGPGHLTNADKGHNRVLEHAGISKDMNLHGLRKSFLTLWEISDLPAGAASQIAGHAPKSIGERHYVNRGMDHLRDLMTRYEKWVLEQAGVRVAEPAITNLSRKTMIQAAS